MDQQTADDGGRSGGLPRYPVLTFFVLAFAISWGGILIVTLPTGIPGRGAALDGLLVPVILAMLAGPFVGSIVLSAAIGGRAGLAGLFAGFTLWRFGWANLALATLPIPAAALAVLLPLSLLSPAYTPGFLGDGGGLAMIGLSLAGGLIVALIEETGWTGFATPRLLARHGVMVAAGILGVVHGVWHFMSNVWMEGAEFGMLFLPYFLTAWILAIVNMRILAVRLYRKTGGSTLIGAIVHASHTGGMLAIWPRATAPVQDLAWTAAFAGLGALVLWGAIRKGWI
jgi:membrane protease YdiL (CAAX protease family)